MLTIFLYWFYLLTFNVRYTILYYVVGLGKVGSTIVMNKKVLFITTPKKDSCPSQNGIYFYCCSSRCLCVWSCLCNLSVCSCSYDFFGEFTMENCENIYQKSQ